MRPPEDAAEEHRLLRLVVDQVDEGVVADELRRLRESARPEGEEDGGGGRLGALLGDLDARLVEGAAQAHAALRRQDGQVGRLAEEVAHAQLVQDLEEGF